MLRPGTTPNSPVRRWATAVVKGLALLLGWLVVAVPAALTVFLNSSRNAVIASHDAVVRPTLDGYATLDLGPFLPNLRYPTESWLGAQLDLGKTTLTSYEALIQRYAFIGAHPDGQIANLRNLIADMIQDSLVSGALIGLAGPGLWLLLGHSRREQLFHHLTAKRIIIALVAIAVAVVAVLQPWSRFRSDFTEPVAWQPIEDALPTIPLPPAAKPIEVQAGLMTTGTRRLAESAFDTYTTSQRFYTDLAEAANNLGAELRQPADDETVALLVSDRHDNVGMDQVARAIADAAGATVLLDAGDDTSTGGSWEAFSLESLGAAFSDYGGRFAVAGNHDHGDFVSDYLGELGFTVFPREPADAEPVEGPGGSTLLGVADARSSGLGSWRTATGLSFHEHEQVVADVACTLAEDDRRVNTLLVHDANTGREALQRGCVDLVLGGHLHVRQGPTRVEGENGEVGYTYTNGTTGGAAYALAMGSKLRRNAMVTLVTYRDGEPVGIQPVVIRTDGEFRVEEYVELELETGIDVPTGPGELPEPTETPLEPQPLPPEIAPDAEDGPPVS